MQRNHLTGHYRVLDQHDLRWAWGNETHCREALARLAPEATPQKHVVVLLHGLFRGPRSMAGLERRLRADGYATVAMAYASSYGGLETHATALRALLSALPAQHVTFVTHSLGGLVVRTALAREDGRPMPQVDGIIMLFPPNRGAWLADKWHGNIVARRIVGPVLDDLTTERARAIPIPAVPIAVVAGGRGNGIGRSWFIPGDNDGTVAVRETLLPRLASFHVLDVGHTFGMNDETVQREVLQVLAEFAGARRALSVSTP
jgi:pimeloyl-ACP methyl ester carboxylesterase